jgi:hypothetical protein
MRSLSLPPLVMRTSHERLCESRCSAKSGYRSRQRSLGVPMERRICLIDTGKQGHCLGRKDI